MSVETDLIALVRKYFDAIENGAPGESLQFFAEDLDLSRSSRNRRDPLGLNLLGFRKFTAEIIVLR